MKRLLLVLALAALPLPTDAEPLTPAMRAEVVKALAGGLRSQYVFADRGDEAARRIESRLAAHAYDAIREPAAFAQALTADLRAVTHDLHLGVRLRPPADPRTRAQIEAELDARRRFQNFGFARIERLKGNVGYLDLRFFAPPAKAREYAAAAMRLLANSDALIIDLRQNSGGSPDMNQLLASFFFDRRVHLVDIWRREGNRTQEYWTLDSVPGTRMPSTPLYLLTSHDSFSAAEGFAYMLQQQKRATIVGEVTGGGANPGAEFDLPGPFTSFIPNGRALNPVTKTNWEGVGVKPDVAASARDAYDAAYELALKAIAPSAEAQWALAGLEARRHPVQVSAASLARLAGRYGVRTVTLHDGALVYQREGRPPSRLTPLTTSLFAIEGSDSVRIRFEPGRLVVLYDDGESDPSPRTVSAPAAEADPRGARRTSGGR
jgi:retinol-binding protein 3